MATEFVNFYAAGFTSILTTTAYTKWINDS